MKTKINSNEKIQYGTRLIFLGLIFLFIGQGEGIETANNFLFFAAAAAFYGFSNLLTGKLKMQTNYITICLLILFCFDILYFALGEYSSGVAKGLFLNLLLIFTCMHAKIGNKDIKLIINGMIYSALIFSVFLLILGKGFSEDIYNKTTYTQPFGKHTELEPNFLAFLLITGFEFCVFAALKNFDNANKKQAILYSSFAGITFLSSLITGSRSTLVTACIYGIILILFMKNHKTRNKLLIVIFLLIIVLIIAIQQDILSDDIYMRLFKKSYSDPSNDKRIVNWQHGLMVIRDKPLGAGPYESYLITRSLYGYSPAVHNTFIAFGAYFGFVGFITFAILIIGLAISAWRFKQRELFAMIVSMIFEWNILECQITITMWIFLLICILMINQLKQGKDINIF